MSNWSLRDEIAKEVFLDLAYQWVRDQSPSKESLISRAERSFKIADAFDQIRCTRDETKSNIKPEPSQPKTRGCPTCFGSGRFRPMGAPKSSKPKQCEECKGTGRVPLV